MRKPSSAKEERQTLKELYLVQGLSAFKIATMMKVSARHVYDLLKLHGLSRKKKLPQPKYCRTCGQIVDK
jgi:transposase